MAKVNLYVRDDLKARMDEVGDAVNWSEVARPAFETAVANHEHRKGQNMTTAIERLRASKQETVQSEGLIGKRMGRAWAENKATYQELRDMSRLDFSHGEYRGAEETFYRAIAPNDECDLSEFRTYCFGDDDDVSDEFVVGFVEGAQEFFQEVRDEL